MLRVNCFNMKKQMNEHEQMKKSATIILLIVCKQRTKNSNFQLFFYF